MILPVEIFYVRGGWVVRFIFRAPHLSPLDRLEGIQEREERDDDEKRGMYDVRHRGYRIHRVRMRSRPCCRRWGRSMTPPPLFHLLLLLPHRSGIALVRATCWHAGTALFGKLEQNFLGRVNIFFLFCVFFFQGVARGMPLLRMEFWY